MIEEVIVIFFFKIFLNFEVVVFVLSSDGGFKLLVCDCLLGVEDMEIIELGEESLVEYSFVSLMIVLGSKIDEEEYKIDGFLE